MDEAIVKYYRTLLKMGFEHAGTIQNPTIFLDAVGESARICDRVGQDSLQVFMKVKEGRVDDIKYLCMCDPTTNVAVEILCVLAEGKSIDEVAAMTPQAFAEVLGSPSEDLVKKAKALMGLVDLGIERYRAGAGQSTR